MRRIEKKPLQSYTGHIPNMWHTVYGYEGCIGALLGAAGLGVKAIMYFAVPEPTGVTKFLGVVYGIGAVVGLGISLKVCGWW